ncbi:GGDEF domain-containing protein [Microvirga makkahensis]|uniref:diguanylate cyclase n=1 Tax=Microvirga makkahensis TaxID=1128670 RepID=A0A7X3MU60_9HYPH|nr:GGDEF domain-containing protein [Microvirga makkahensis]MXQ13302.1 diguanylate cyclase [Microvirga makkahensis]
MTLDPATLNVAFVLLALVLGGLLVFAWTVNRNVRALLSWGAAFCLVATGFAVANLGRSSGSYSALLIGNVFGLLSYVALYAGCRIFNGRKGVPLVALTGVVLWSAAFPFIYERQDYRLILVALTTGVYSLLSAWELWRYAGQPLASQRFAVVLLVLLAVFNTVRIWPAVSSTSISWFDALAHRWSSEMALFLVVFTPSLAFIFLSMAKESVELGYKLAALVDPLTGIPNRRAFMQNAGELTASMHGKPVSCLVLDLDNFKSINDRYGHDVGDAVLTLFGQVLSRHLPPKSFGRLGGEEFAAILPMNMECAAALGEAVRDEFSRAGKAVLGAGAEVTVSVGCSASSDATVEMLLHEADIALYRAKDRGRNIVVSSAGSRVSA